MCVQFQHGEASGRAGTVHVMFVQNYIEQTLDWRNTLLTTTAVGLLPHTNASIQPDPASWIINMFVPTSAISAQSM